MATKRQKILIADNRPDVIGALKKILSRYDVTTVADPHEAARLAAQEAFDLVITEYVIPSVSGIESITGKKPSEGESAREKASILKEFRTIIKETGGAEKTASYENTVVDSQARQENILESLNNHVRQIDAERVELRLEVQRLHKELESTLKLKSELERDIASVRQEMTRNNDALQEKISALEGELGGVVARTEALKAEKAESANELRRVIEEADRTASDFNKKIDSLTALMNETFSEAEALRKAGADGQEELARFRRETGKIVSDLQQQIKSLSEDLEAVNRKRAEAEADSVRIKNESARRISELNRKIETLANELSAAIDFAEQAAKERSEIAEKISSLEEEVRKTEELKAKVDSLTEELKKMAAIAENAQTEKARAEEKLFKLQQNWEKYVAGS
ncbi:MAG TPA: hypothetical protein HPP81_05175 [Deltaproteobacteria bacterium]|jgi:chromosome segregation ATPase|nr:hypothetical protein [Deltaproteobacteria bacterium]HIJ76089.1 hypothetical protein [Deltaproteobacteria bacterium]